MANPQQYEFGWQHWLCCVQSVIVRHSQEFSLTGYTNSGADGQTLTRPTWPQAPSLGFLTVNSLANQTIGFSKHLWRLAPIMISQIGLTTVRRLALSGHHVAQFQTLQVMAVSFFHKENFQMTGFNRLLRDCAPRLTPRIRVHSNNQY